MNLSRATTPTLIQAAWIAPMDRECIRNGAIIFDGGLIAGAGDAAALRSSYPSARLIDLQNSIVLPGLVNAHLHLELSNLSRRPLPAGGFVQWLLEIIARRTTLDIAAAVSTGVRQCMRFGVTTVGDITAQCALSRAALAKTPLRGISYGEVQAMAQRRDLLDARISAALDDSAVGERIGIGISPHTPYTVEPHAFARCIATGLPIATHLAESPDEAEFLAEHAGAFRDLWETLGWWDERVPRFAGGPIRFAKSIGLLDMPALLAHVNYCDDDELALLAAGRASVVYCPRTHAYFGHAPHRWRDMLRVGINVAVGTDSAASSPDLNLVDDLRLLHTLAPDVPATSLWQLATIRGAAALQLHDRVGSLTVGKFADCVAWPLRDGIADPLEAILKSDAPPSHVWIDGEEIHR